MDEKKFMRGKMSVLIIETQACNDWSKTAYQGQFEFFL